MAPELGKGDLKAECKTTIGVAEKLEADPNLELVTDVGGVDHFVTKPPMTEERIFVVPDSENPEIVKTIFFTEGARQHVNPLKKEGVVFDASPEISNQY